MLRLGRWARGACGRSLAERPDLDRPLGLDRVWPEFLKHGDVTNLYWNRLYEDLPEFQLVLVDDEGGEVLGRGNTIPFEWDGSIPGLPAGVDGVLERDSKAAGRPTRSPRSSRSSRRSIRGEA